MIPAIGAWRHLMPHRITHYRWTGQDGGGGPIYDSTDTYAAFIELGTNPSVVPQGSIVGSRLHIVVGAPVLFDPRDRVGVPKEFGKRDATGVFQDDVVDIQSYQPMMDGQAHHHTELWTS